MPVFPVWARYALGAALLLLVLYVALDRYGDARFREGEAHADAQWQKASDKLIEDAARAATKADRNAAGRAADFAAKQESEKEKIDAAVEHGSSPLDVLFNS